MFCSNLHESCNSVEYAFLEALDYMIILFHIKEDNLACFPFLKFFQLSCHSLLKVWNLNNFSGVLGIFNCQGAGTWPFLDTSQSYTSSEQSYLTGHVSPIDIEFLDEVTGENCTSDCAVFCFKTGKIHLA